MTPFRLPFPFVCLVTHRAQSSVQAQHQTIVGEEAQPVAGCEAPPQPGQVWTVKPFSSTWQKAGMATMTADDGDS